MQGYHVYGANGPMLEATQYEWEVWRMSAIRLRALGSLPVLYANQQTLDNLARELGQDFVCANYAHVRMLPDDIGVDSKTYWAWPKLWAIRDASLRDDAQQVFCDTDAILFAIPELGKNVWMSEWENPYQWKGYYPQCGPVPAWASLEHTGWGNGSVIAYDRSTKAFKAVICWLDAAFKYMEGTERVHPLHNWGGYLQMCRVEQSFLHDAAQVFTEGVRWWMDAPYSNPLLPADLQRGMIHVGPLKAFIRKDELLLKKCQRKLTAIAVGLDIPEPVWLNP